MVAVRARVSGNGFAVYAQGKIHIVKQPRHGIGRDLDIELAKQFGDSGRCLDGSKTLAGDLKEFPDRYPSRQTAIRRRMRGLKSRPPAIPQRGT
jgi:hypothetical protein